MIESELNNFFERLPGIRALVLGDVMIDRYSYVRQERMSPEAPVPVWDVEHRDSRLGGAGHVALNLKSLVAKCVWWAWLVEMRMVLYCSVSCTN